MTLNGKRVLILLGGQWHDFDGFATAIKPLLEKHGMLVEATYDLDTLLRLAEDQYDAVLSYTCFTSDEGGGKGSDRLSQAQFGNLAGWVQGGGAFLALHAATVIGESDPALGDLIGGVFVSHPPQFAFTVYPIFGDHPIIAGIEAFTVHDEFYIERQTSDVQVHMVAFDRGVAYPMAWSRVEGRGRIAHIAPGHSQAVWDLEPYQRLLLQALDWIMGKN
ncbi:MAG TPA: ThuA domain-containing protein [Anaerolineales bacterium]|nr:ThuA domain-containing protein [Anaerolineales bacterium]